MRRDSKSILDSRCWLHLVLAMFPTLLAFGAWDEHPQQGGTIWIAWLTCCTVVSVVVETYLRWLYSFELQLLPSGIKQTEWGRTTELVEPEIVGGQWLRWTNSIKLRAGEKQVSISLGNFSNVRDRAAIIAHCSQFLSPAQVAEFGSEWTRAYYAIVTPPKPYPVRLVVVCSSFYLVGCLFLVAVTEGILWYYPDAVHASGGSLRLAYYGLPLFPLLIIGPIGLSAAIERYRPRPARAG